MRRRLVVLCEKIKGPGMEPWSKTAVALPRDRAVRPMREVTGPMKSATRGRSAAPRGLRAGITATILAVVACFGAAIALAHARHGPEVAPDESSVP